MKFRFRATKGTFISNVYLRFLNNVPAVASSGADLGFRDGIAEQTTTGGVDVAAAITDGVLDNAGDGSSLVEDELNYCAFDG